ncbi:MAG: hypothetical protein AMXMBFR34_48470 [Myxococcaceae bacterium]
MRGLLMRRSQTPERIWTPAGHLMPVDLTRAWPMRVFDAGAFDAGQPDAGPDTVFYGPLPYRSRADSPFTGQVFASYEHFEDVEDHLLSVPGVYTAVFPTSSLYAQIYIDSVDGDDGRVDSACSTCDSLFTPNGAQGASFTFDPTTLGALPTHVGIAWTDGVGATVTVTFYGPGGTLVGAIQGTNLGDGTYTSSFAEDRFFGAFHRAGISRVVVQDPGAGIDLDHLFYAR